MTQQLDFVSSSPIVYQRSTPLPTPKNGATSTPSKTLLTFARVGQKPMKTQSGRCSILDQSFFINLKINGQKPICVASQRRMSSPLQWILCRKSLISSKTLLPNHLHGFGNSDVSPYCDNAHVDGERRQRQKREKAAPISHEWI